MRPLQALTALRQAFAGMAIRDCSGALEVVEVKNTCPFQLRTVALSKKGRPRRRYVLADSGPRERVLCRLNLMSVEFLCDGKISQIERHIALPSRPCIGQVLCFFCEPYATGDLLDIICGACPPFVVVAGARARCQHAQAVAVTRPPQVEKQWVPQLQMHMLAAPAQSALLVSRSATKARASCIRVWECITCWRCMILHICCELSSPASCQLQWVAAPSIRSSRGVQHTCPCACSGGAGATGEGSVWAAQGLTVFRMWRDDAYINAMLGLIRHLYQHHVQPRCPPPADPYAHLPGYQGFLQRTAEVAASASMVMHVPAQELVNPSREVRRFV